MDLRAWFQTACDQAIVLATQAGKNEARLKDCITRLRHYREARFDDPDAAKAALSYVCVVSGHLDDDLMVARSLEAEMDRRWGPSKIEADQLFHGPRHPLGRRRHRICP